MIWLRYAPSIAVAVAVTAGTWWVMNLRAENARLSNAVQVQAQSIAALERSAAQAREAAQVAKANADREAARAREYDALREALLKEDTDVELPSWFRDWLSDLGVGVLRN